MPVTSDTARAISILASLLWAAGVAGARQYRLELSLDHRLDELAHPIAQADFDRIKPIIEKMDRRLGFTSPSGRRDSLRRAESRSPAARRSQRQFRSSSP